MSSKEAPFAYVTRHAPCQPNGTNWLWSVYLRCPVRVNRSPPYLRSSQPRTVLPLPRPVASGAFFQADRALRAGLTVAFWMLVMTFNKRPGGCRSSGLIRASARWSPRDPRRLALSKKGADPSAASFRSPSGPPVPRWYLHDLSVRSAAQIPRKLLGWQPQAPAHRAVAATTRPRSRRPVHPLHGATSSPKINCLCRIKQTAA